MKCIAGAWRGRDVELVVEDRQARLEAVLPPRGGVATAETLQLSELEQPNVLDRGVHLQFGRGLAFAAIPLIAALFLYDYPLFFTCLLALTLVVFFEQSVVVRYVVEFQVTSSGFGLVLAMERDDWLPLMLLKRGYIDVMASEPTGPSAATGTPAEEPQA